MHEGRRDELGVKLKVPRLIYDYGFLPLYIPQLVLQNLPRRVGLKIRAEELIIAEKFAQLKVGET